MNWTEEEQMTDDVIPIARGREPLWAGPHLPLREAILEAIREYALEEKSDDEDDERAKHAIEVLVCVLLDAGMPFESWKDELGDRELAGLKILGCDLFDDPDPLMMITFVKFGNQEIGAVEERYYGSHRAFQTTVDVAELGVFPDGYIELGVFPNFELAKQAVCEAHQP
jgi:hypothetical protein